MFSAKYTALAAITFLFIAETASACSCGRRTHDPDMGTRLAIAGADVAFMGTVSSVVPKTLPELDGVNLNEVGYLPGTEGRIVTFEIERMWKGPSGLVEIELFDGVTNCDFYFEVGDQALLFVNWSEHYGHHTTNQCIMMTGFSGSDDEYAVFIDSIDMDRLERPGDDFVTYGCGGGITGAFSKTTIYRDGRRVSTTSKPGQQNDSRTRELGPDPEFAQEFFENLDYNELVRIDGTNEPGNYYCSLRADILGREYSATWSNSEKISSSMKQMLARVNE